MMNNYLKSAEKEFLYYKSLGEKAMEQLTGEQLSWQYNEESNSIAVLVRHLSGNMLSRFTDFLTTDGEKPWRNRDQEFVSIKINPKELIEYWNKGWTCLLEALNLLSEKDLESIVYIRNERHTVIEALNRQLAHYAYHVGQIIFIAKMLKDQEWKTLSIARNESVEFNEKKFSKEKE